MCFQLVALSTLTVDLDRCDDSETASSNLLYVAIKSLELLYGLDPLVPLAYNLRECVCRRCHGPVISVWVCMCVCVSPSDLTEFVPVALLLML